jgi:lipopolysaccharide/colanic/teichoic acid biosynthesis glycosyltransferase
MQRILFVDIAVQQPKISREMLMGRSKLEMNPFLIAEDYKSKTSVVSSPQQELRKSAFMPRYVSGWCMSKRKRCFDLVLSVSALAVFSPAMVLIGWLIKVTSTGPALFRQERIGLNQQPFIILKFRTMNHSSSLLDRGSKVTKQGDPRMTNVGALLRRLKLDELPQLINVARGEMSFVGPRPKIPQHECLSMMCRPGITGAATIVFSDEENLLADVPVEIVEDYVTSVLNPEKCRLDSHYIETARFWTDMRIMIRTIFKLGNQTKTIREPERVFSLPLKGLNRRSTGVMLRVDRTEISTIEA